VIIPAFSKLCQRLNSINSILILHIAKQEKIRIIIIFV